MVETLPTARRSSPWLVGCLTVVTGLMLLVGLFGGWAVAILFEVIVVLLLAPSMVVQYRLARPSALQRALAIVAGGLLAWAWLWAFCGPMDHWSSTIGWGNRPFDSAVWQAAPRSIDDRDEEHNPRGAMLRSLLRNHRLRGLTKAEVVALLGKPDPADGISSSRVPQYETWDYYVGWYSGFKLDPDFLAVMFGLDGRVADWAIWQS
jgi:hypothetical protein